VTCAFNALNTSTVYSDTKIAWGLTVDGRGVLERTAPSLSRMFTRTPPPEIVVVYHAVSRVGSSVSALTPIEPAGPAKSAVMSFDEVLNPITRPGVVVVEYHMSLRPKVGA
jgi:hypothetical protein